jgi:uncharacterized Zn finger protein (UPF0148 family)
MLASRTFNSAVASNRCSSCGNGLVRNRGECYCPKCGYVEEVVFDGV